MRLTAPNRRQLRTKPVVIAKATASKTPWEADFARPRKCALAGCNKRFIPKGNEKTCGPVHAKAIARQRRRKCWSMYYAASRDRINARVRDRYAANPEKFRERYTFDPFPQTNREAPMMPVPALPRRACCCANTRNVTTNC
jgi:hypothetical protein